MKSNIENLKGMFVVIVTIAFLTLFINAMIILISENLFHVKVAGILAFLMWAFLINAIIDLSNAEKRYFQNKPSRNAQFKKDGK